ncbi:hypothetical protein Droror1_Dr00025171 [Drosera rotundifolia]
MKINPGAIFLLPSPFPLLFPPNLAYATAHTAAATACLLLSQPHFKTLNPKSPRSFDLRRRRWMLTEKPWPPTPLTGISDSV